MKLTTRGFTLVELMIVIAIIGILAAALFPSLTNYLKRSRDAARAAGLKDISTAVGAYYSDKEGYPNSGSGCMDSSVLNSSYMEAGVPKDPTTTQQNGCGVAGLYVYGSGTSAATSPQFALGAQFENINGGNSSTGAWSISGVFTSASRTAFDAYVIKKGNGSGYILYK